MRIRVCAAFVSALARGCYWRRLSECRVFHYLSDCSPGVFFELIRQIGRHGGDFKLCASRLGLLAWVLCHLRHSCLHASQCEQHAV
eukprot:6491085-Amphidinium_carterae.1